MASLSASETEFLAEQELIAILPHFHLRANSGMLNFISPGITTHVPLWLAIMLKQLNKCRILAPPWLSVDYLASRLEREKNSEVFEELPFHYLEVASLLLKNAPEDLDQGEHVRSLLEDLQNVRQDKIRKGLSKIADDVQGGETAFAIQMNNISALEINSVREFMIGHVVKRAFGVVVLCFTEDENDTQTQSQSQGYSEPSSAESPAAQRLRRFRG
uniref:DNA replication complex GINS protein PSF2 n=1 Tax=Phytophthora ramorum TaxID=164328 RepID=H3H255_PHYRM